jgi:two-component system CheB/CheR fusion protein
LQSLNEELVTVNTQLQSKVHELEGLTNDLNNLLSSTDIAVVFLDTRLCVRRFTPAVSDLLQLLASDIGRPLAHLAQTFTGGDLLADAARVLAKLAPLECEVHSHSDRWYLRRVLPYRTEDNRIGGVVITFIEITARKHAEQAIEASQERLQALIEQTPAAMLMVEHPSGRLLLANRRAAQLFNQPFPLPQIGSASNKLFQGSRSSRRWSRSGHSGAEARVALRTCARTREPMPVRPRLPVFAFVGSAGPVANTMDRRVAVGTAALPLS